MESGNKFLFFYEIWNLDFKHEEKNRINEWKFGKFYYNCLENQMSEKCDIIVY